MLSGVHSIEWFGVQALGCPVVWSLGFRLLPLVAVSHEYGNQSGGLLLQNRQSCGLSLRSGRNLARGECFFANPWNPSLRDQRAPAAAGAREVPANPCRGAYRCSSSTQRGSLRSPPANFLSPRWGGIRYRIYEIMHSVRKLANRSLLKLGFDRARRPYLAHEIDRSGRFKTSRSQETSCHRSSPPQAADAVNQY